MNKPSLHIRVAMEHQGKLVNGHDIPTLKQIVGGEKVDQAVAEGKIVYQLWQWKTYKPEPIANCSDEKSAVAIMNLLNDHHDHAVNVHATAMDINYTFAIARSKFTEEMTEHFDIALDKMEGVSGLYSLISDISEEIENAMSNLDLDWERVEFYGVTEEASHILVDQLTTRDAPSIDAKRTAYSAIIAGAQLFNALYKFDLDKLPIDQATHQAASSKKIKNSRVMEFQAFQDIARHHAKTRHNDFSLVTVQGDELVTAFSKLSKTQQWNRAEVIKSARAICNKLASERNQTPKL